MEWDKRIIEDHFNRNIEVKEGTDLTAFKRKVALLPDIVPKDITGSILIQLGSILIQLLRRVEE